MFDEEIDPLPRAFNPKRRPALLGMEQSLPYLAVQAFQLVVSRRSVVFDTLHPNPLSRRFADGPGQALGFFLVHRRLFLAGEEAQRYSRQFSRASTFHPIQAVSTIIVHKGRGQRAYPPGRLSIHAMFEYMCLRSTLTFLANNMPAGMYLLIHVGGHVVFLQQAYHPPREAATTARVVVSTVGWRAIPGKWPGETLHCR